MPRPTKLRSVAGVPQYKCFIPAGKVGCRNECKEEKLVLKVEEYEAMRLKDIEELNQEDAAAVMQVSRQTYQRILNGARKKVTKALMEGKAICIRGGDYTVSNCRARCPHCDNEWTENPEICRQKRRKCANCGTEVRCCEM
ncbi:MAG: hypothetical protein PWQ96_902 [Clostridia bacterium]|nr:hypothetical protein [Clostridia bacterium]